MSAQIDKMGSVYLIAIFLWAVVNLSSCHDVKNFNNDPDVLRNVSQLISSKGYPVEEHTVQTRDGFLLGVQRIPHGKKGRGDAPRPAIFLQHGLLSCSADYVINFPQQSLGFVLADLGYDVWLGNTRGNTYSRHHVKYSPRQREFWDFSFDQMAEYDLPAMIDFVLNATEQNNLVYVGHSQGTSAAFALLSESPEYNKKIKLFLALAPVATVGYITTAIKYIAPFTYDLDLVMRLLGMNEFLPSSAFLRFLSEIMCERKHPVICEDIMFLIMGADKQQMNETRVGVYTTHFPAGSSAKSIVHYGQLVNSKLFRKFDYGEKGNKHHYNQSTPPDYDLGKITTPVALLWALNDDLADPTDVGILRGKLKSIVADYCVPDPVFNHCDFVYAMQAPELVNKKILEILKKFEQYGLERSANGV